MPTPPRTRIRRIAALGTATLAASLLAACNATIPKDTASPYYRVGVGSTLQLRHKIEIPPGRARVFIQNGSITANFDHYAPNCNVEVEKLDYQQLQYIEPGSYRIRRVQDNVEEVVQSQRMQVAALKTGSWLAAAADNSGGTTMVYRGYHLWVDDPAGNFTRLSCRGAYADPVDARPPSINEMRQALGGIASLELHEASTN